MIRVTAAPLAPPPEIYSDRGAPTGPIFRPTTRVTAGLMVRRR